MYQESDIEIRDYKDTDYAKLLKLWEQTDLGSSARGDNDAVIKRTLGAGGKLLVMSSLGCAEMVGCSWITTDGRRTYLHHFGIHPDFQGQGLGKLLMKASMDYINKLGQQAKLEVNINNKRAINLYKNFDFNYLGDYSVYINRNIPTNKLL